MELIGVLFQPWVNWMPVAWTGRVAVGAAPALDVQPVRDVEGQGRAREEAVLGRVVQVAVHQPERVLHRELVGAPELRREVAVRIEPFVHGIGVQVVAGRHQVQRDQRVVVQAAGEHVLLVHLDVHSQEAQVHPAVQEVHRLAGGEVVTAVLVVGDDAVGAVQAGGDVGGIVLPAQGQAHGVGLVHPGLEEVHDAPVLRDVELAAPGSVLAQLGAVGALQARKHERLGEGRAVGVAHVDALLTGAGGEHEDTVRGLVAVQGGGGRTHQRAHVGHVLRVEHRHAVTGQAGAGVDAPGVVGAAVLAVVAVLVGRDDVGHHLGERGAHPQAVVVQHLVRRLLGIGIAVREFAQAGNHGHAQHRHTKGSQYLVHSLRHP